MSSKNTSQICQTQDGGKCWTLLANMDGLVRRIDYIDKQIGCIVLGRVDRSQQTSMQTIDGGKPKRYTTANWGLKVKPVEWVVDESLLTGQG